MNYTMDDWWASLTVAQKERIASKITKREVHYPECTAVWMELSNERKNGVHDHCVDAHGHIMTEWTEGDTYSY